MSPSLLLGPFEAVWREMLALIWPALAFAALALIARGAAAITSARAAKDEARINLTLLVLDIALLTPLLAAGVAALSALAPRLPASLWTHAPDGVTLLATLLLGDFIAYWRHRLEHVSWLWPFHATHHSDTAMTWTTLFRFHPINRVTSALIDGVGLALLGLPPWALAANTMVRHYYGMFIHMDLPWTYGVLGRVFVSPAMHRWHHVREGEGVGANFATVFSIFDQAFGTYHAPGPCDVALGVPDDMGAGVRGQLLAPFHHFAALLRSKLKPGMEKTSPDCGEPRMPTEIA